MKFSPGDIVVIRDWDDLAAEYGITDGYICPYPDKYFTHRMAAYSGTEVIVDNTTSDGEVFFTDYPIDGMDGWYWYEEFLMLQSDAIKLPSIEINRDSWADILLTAE